MSKKLILIIQFIITVALVSFTWLNPPINFAIDHITLLPFLLNLAIIGSYGVLIYYWDKTKNPSKLNMIILILLIFSTVPVVLKGSNYFSSIGNQLLVSSGVDVTAEVTHKGQSRRKKGLGMIDVFEISYQYITLSGEFIQVTKIVSKPIFNSYVEGAEVQLRYYPNNPKNHITYFLIKGE
ncbi:DUF3592 domain-containing protein [Flammeovirga pectinis]|uniref:DUF3592 domain-containing protein n=1 Tax=Flammeovirga pectinis TaxID=2494373 RepID=A0A3S9P9R8_9BACT|nr:DUF3592 domain-containing protein [Flammeovirga pectinis]AZQ64929.1 DUF3592 domain-containing protein [Flammeovirga pectinis]